MSNPESLLIDMDGVLADTVGGAFDYMEVHNLAHEDVYDYWFEGLDAEAMLSAFRTKGFYRSLDVITGAVRAVNRLREEYNGNVFILSSPISGAEACEGEKREWLEKHFDEDFAREAIIQPTKQDVLGHVLIEDNPDIAGGIWQPIMFDQAWNRNSNYPRMYGWHDLSVVREQMSKERN